MAGQGSARVTLREIDLSQVRNPQQSPQGVPAAVVGTARKGPAFVPRTFANIKQFDEVFGSMLEIGRKANSNLPGPLALNEWMKSAQAGTFLRVLGVGDGNKKITGTTDASLGKVNDAGFVVGNKLVQARSTGNTEGKVAQNPHATISDSAAAETIAKTHFLGCFMKDASGSSFLQDAGIQTDLTRGLLKLNFTGIPTNGTTLTLIGRAADSTQKTFVITINTGNNDVVHGDGTIALGAQDGNAANLEQRLVNALQGKIANGNAHNFGNAAHNPNLYFETSLVADVIEVRQREDGVSSNTVATSALTAAADVLTIDNGTTTIKNSLTSQTVTSTVSGATKTTCAITVGGNPSNNDQFVITDFAGNSAIIKFDITDDDAAANNAGTVTVGIQSSLNNSAAIAARIKLAVDAAITANLFGNAPNRTISTAAPAGAVFTITSELKGNMTAVNFVNLSVNSGSVLSESQANGSNGSVSTVTLALTGQPVADNEFTLNTISETNNASSNLTFKFIAENADPGSANGVVDGSKVQIELGSTIDLTLARIQSAIERSSVGAKYTAVVDASADTIVIKRTQAQGFVQDRDFVFKLNSNVSVTGTENKQGRFGPQTISFAGGGGGASPIIRGVLMMPQGVKPSLDTNSELNGVFSDGATEANIRKEAHGKTFGQDDGNNGSDLAGYLVGKVGSSDQSFELLLNGFSNSDHPAKIKCSFNPDDDSYFAKVLNTDPTRIEEKGHYLYSHWDIDSNVAVPSSDNLLHAGSLLSSGNYANMIGFVMAGAGNGSSATAGPDYDSFEQRFQTAKTPWIVSQFTSVSDNESARPATAAAGGAKKLFRLYSLDDGEAGNTQFRLLISDLRYNGKSDYGTFTLSLEKFDSDVVKGETLVSWKKADLNPDSTNFIGRLIGDEHTFYDFDLDSGKQRLKTKGSYTLKNSYVRIELSDEVKQGLIPVDTLPSGFQGLSHLRTSGITGNFVEQAGLNADTVFTNSGDQALTTLNGAQVLPVDYVKSISRIISGSTEEADADLAWGVKLSVRENKVLDKKELSEQVFNHSIESWTKFYPELGQSHVLESDGSLTDQFQNSFFSLEKIQLGASDAWDGSEYVRKPSAAASGKRFVTISQDAKGTGVKYLKFRCLFQGGFDGVNIFDKEKSELTSVASVREGQDETGGKKFTGPTIMSYRSAIDVLADKSAAEFQLLSIPGQRASQITDFAINACEDRFDALLVMDVIEKTAASNHVELSSEKPHVRNTISSFEDRTLDTSFAAAYFPDVLVRRPSDDVPVIMPPSVGMMGVMSRNDSIADPWFAPAGLRRGRLGAIDSQVQMNRELLDELYNADINPIYVLVGCSGEVYAFGQKTLLQDASALDRINVRRLLIDIRRKVKKVGEQLLFEPNRASTLTKFSSLVEPIMADVQQRRGVERYKVQIDTTTTTQSDVENNTIRGKIYLQPTKSVEFISLDFVVANNIQ
jgi:hypothetical protein